MFPTGPQDMTNVFLSLQDLFADNLVEPNNEFMKKIRT